MADFFVQEDVKTRLLISGIKELTEFGARDFSLRRAAVAAGVSCAAPYRYFKGKEDYVSEIIFYLASKWELLADEISKACGADGEILIPELAAANVRFWLSNKNLKTALLVSSDENSLVKPSVFDARLVREITAHFTKKGVPIAERIKKINSIRAYLIGCVTLIGSGELPDEEKTYDGIKEYIKASV